MVSWHALGRRSQWIALSQPAKERARVLGTLLPFPDKKQNVPFSPQLNPLLLWLNNITDIVHYIECVIAAPITIGSIVATTGCRVSRELAVHWEIGKACE